MSESQNMRGNKYKCLTKPTISTINSTFPINANDNTMINHISNLPRQHK